MEFRCQECSCLLESRESIYSTGKIEIKPCSMCVKKYQNLKSSMFDDILSSVSGFIEHLDYDDIKWSKDYD